MLNDCPLNFDGFFIINSIEVEVSKQEFLEELIAYFPLIGHGPHRKRRAQDLLSTMLKWAKVP
jgi:hypothetical protein